MVLTTTSLSLRVPTHLNRWRQRFRHSYELVLTDNVAYNHALKQFTFKTADLTDAISLKNTGTNLNALFGLGTSGRVLSVDVATGAPGAEVIPQGDFILPEVQQRQGVVVEFVPNTAAGSTDGHFTISSGSTGDQSSIALSSISANAATYLGFDATSTSVQRPLSVGRESGDSAVQGVCPRRKGFRNTDPVRSRRDLQRGWYIERVHCHD